MPGAVLKGESGKNTINLRVRAIPQLSPDTKINTIGVVELDISPLIISKLSCQWAQPFWQPKGVSKSRIVPVSRRSQWPLMAAHISLIKTRIIGSISTLNLTGRCSCLLYRY